MNWLAKMLLDGVDWSSFRAMNRDGIAGPATLVPATLRNMVEWPTYEDTPLTDLDNYVVVQGSVFSAALPVIPVVLALLSARNLPNRERRNLLDLLFELQYGNVDEGELAAGGTNELGKACVDTVRTGLWLYYQALQDDHPQVRKTATDLIGALELDLERRRVVLEHLVADDPDERVRESAAWWLENKLDRP